MGLREETLRRRILLGGVAATPVDDDRQYLVDLPGPAPRPRRTGRLLLWSVAAWAVLGLAHAAGITTISETCPRCGAETRIERLFGVPMSCAPAVPGCGHDWKPAERRD
jgi:hypothetical protein